MPILPLYNTHGQLPGYRSRIKRCPQRFAEKQKEQTVKCHKIGHIKGPISCRPKPGFPVIATPAFYEPYGHARESVEGSAFCIVLQFPPAACRRSIQ